MTPSTFPVVSAKLKPFHAGYVLAVISQHIRDLEAGRVPGDKKIAEEIREQLLEYVNFLEEMAKKQEAENGRRK